MKEQHFDQPVAELIRRRISVRTYQNKELEAKVADKLIHYTDTLVTPFMNQVKLKYIPGSVKGQSQKLGTYGVIKNAPAFLGVTVEKAEEDLVAAGYAMEKTILYAASQGLGTCWLGGTFKKSTFADIMEVQENQLFPAITPVGYPQEKGHLMGNMVRKMAKSDSRKPWAELFFDQGFETGLTKEAAGFYQEILEGVRLAPSASNKQPWRVVKEGGNFHFYMEKTPGYNEKLGYAIQKVDLGIALCHFHLAAQEAGAEFDFKKTGGNCKKLPDNVEYITSLLAH